MTVFNNGKITRIYNSQVNFDLAKDMLANMPAEMRRRLSKTIYRNYCFTSCAHLSWPTMKVYKEGWYIEADGCQCHFAMWVGDNDGEYVYGRKPSEKKLHFLYESILRDENGIELELDDYYDDTLAI